MLTKENFFKGDTNYRCNMVRKKNKKNLTVLVKSSGNILKSIH